MVNLTKGRAKTCKDNQGGLCKVYLFPFVKYNRSQIVLIDNILTSFPLTEIYEFEFDNEAAYNDNGDENDGGKFYNQNINLEFAEIELYSDFVQLLDKDYRLIIKDRIGNFRLLGCYNGLVCNSLKMTTGSARTDFRGFTLSFEGLELKQAPFINSLEDAGFTVINNKFLATEDCIYLLTQSNKLIRIEE